MKRIIFLAFLFLTTVLSTATYAAAQASIDRASVNINETFTLELSSDDMDADAPELTLPDGLKILRRSNLSSRSLINGKAISEQRWKYQIVAQTAGDFLIAEQRVGKDKTSALALRVLMPSSEAKDKTSAGQKILLRAELNTTSVLAQQQLLLTIKLMSAVPVRFAQLTEPQVANASVHLLTPDSKYETDSNGLRYTVLERRYAIFPEQAGDYQIAPLQFNGDISARRQSSLGGFFDDTEPVQLQTAALTFTAQNNESSALPAGQFNLHADVAASGAKPQVGEPLTLTITTKASEQIASNLPVLAFSDSADYRVYPDQPQDQISTDSTGVHVQRVQKFALVPLHAGPLAWPKIDQLWRNNKSGEEQRAVLELPDLMVAPAATTANALAAPKITSNSPARSELNEATTTIVPVAKNYWLWLWPSLCALLVLTNLLSVWLWWRAHQRSGQATTSGKKPAMPVTNPDSKGAHAAEKTLRAACKNNDAKAAQQALLAYANVLLSQHAKRNGNSAEPQADTALHWHAVREQLSAWAALLDSVEAAQFAPSATPWQGIELLSAIDAIAYALRTNNSVRQSLATTLAPLNPDAKYTLESV